MDQNNEFDYSGLRVLPETSNSYGRFGVEGECIQCDPAKKIEASALNKKQALAGLRKLYRIHVRREHVEGNQGIHQ